MKKIHKITACLTALATVLGAALMINVTKNHSASADDGALAFSESARISETAFEKSAVPLPDLSGEHIFPNKIHVKALFDAQCKWRLIEEYGSGCFTEREDGRLLFSRDYTDEEHLILWILGFGEKAEILEPESAREKLQKTIRRMEERYR